MRSIDEMLEITRAKGARLQARRHRAVAAGVACVLVGGLLALAVRPNDSRDQVSTASESARPTTTAAVPETRSTEETTSTIGDSAVTPASNTTTTTTIEHREAAPGLTLEITTSTTTTTAGSTVGLDIHATDDIGGVYRFEVGWGDGTAGENSIFMPGCVPGQGHQPGEPQPTAFDRHADHVYETAGTFTLSVTVHTRRFCDDRYDEVQTEEEATRTVEITVT